MKSLLIRPPAAVEIEEAYRWYEGRREGLGADFILCLEEAFEKVRRNPEMYPVVYKKVRRVLMRRFPYGVF